MRALRCGDLIHMVNVKNDFCFVQWILFHMCIFRSYCGHEGSSSSSPRHHLKNIYLPLPLPRHDAVVAPWSLHLFACHELLLLGNGILGRRSPFPKRRSTRQASRWNNHEAFYIHNELYCKPDASKMLVRLGKKCFNILKICGENTW